jgi:hypothetical protein
MSILSYIITILFNNTCSLIDDFHPEQLSNVEFLLEFLKIKQWKIEKETYRSKCPDFNKRRNVEFMEVNI